MKKWLIYLLPLILIITSMVSLYYTNIRQEQFLAISRQLPTPIDLEDLVLEETFNRPALLDPIHGKAVLLLLNEMPNSFFDALSQEAFDQLGEDMKVVQATVKWEPINDLDFNYQVLVSGLDPLRADAFLKIASRESDSLPRVIQDYEKTVYASDELQELAYPHPEWKESFFSILNATDSSWMSEEVNIAEWVDLVMELVNQSDPDTVFFVSSLLAPANQEVSWKARFQHSIPLCIIGKELVLPEEKPQLRVDDFTATIAFALGIPSPTASMGLPLFSIFPLEDNELIDRLYYSSQNYLTNSLYSMNDFHLDETISTGFFFQYSDLIEYSKNTDSTRMGISIHEMDTHFREFIASEKEHANVFPMIFAVILMTLLLIAWLIFLPYHFRAYLYGIFGIACLILLHLLVFRQHVQMPAMHLFSWEWILTEYMWPFILSTLFLGIMITLLGGFVFNYALRQIIIQIQGALGTFLVFFTVEAAYFSIRDGIVISRTMPGFFTQAFLYRNLSYIALLPLALLGMVAIAAGIYGFTLRMARKKS